jgi:hypothetical protein
MGGSFPRSKVNLGYGRGWATAEAAASIFRMDRQIGHPLQITEAGRDWAEQNKHYQHYLRYGSPIALNPNTPSVHQVGDAIDSDELQLDIGLANAHGWVRTVYRWVNGKWTLVERWHFEHFIAQDSHRFDPNPADVPPAPEPEEEEDDMVGSIYARGTGNGNVYEIRNGKKRKITYAEWQIVLAAYAAAGEPVPYADNTVTHAALEAFLNF